MLTFPFSFASGAQICDLGSTNQMLPDTLHSHTSHAGRSDSVQWHWLEQFYLHINSETCLHSFSVLWFHIESVYKFFIVDSVSCPTICSMT